ncbi:MAG: glycosyltransferase [Terracoccus sp.]
MVATRPLRVVQVITSLPTGGAERQLELLVGRTHEQTTTIALYDGGPVADSMRAAGHRVEVLGMQGWRRFVAPVRLARRLRRLRPDVVHVHLLAAQLWGIPAARLARVKVVVSSEHSLMHDTIEGRPHTRWLRRLYRLLEAMTTRTVAVSATTAQRLRDWGVPAGKIVVSDNGIDFAALELDASGRDALRRELGLTTDATVIGAVGRLDPVKRIDLVLHACAPLLRDGAALVVAGSGPLGPELQALSERLGVASAVHWLGSRGDMTAVLSAMDVLVSASADETFGMAVVEALGNGLPVTFVECPALEELSCVPSHAHQVARTGDEQVDAVALRDGVRQGLADGRRPVPAELRERYGVLAATQRMERLHAQLVGDRDG